MFVNHLCPLPQDLLPTDLNINRDHLLIKDYLPAKFEAYGTMHSWVNSCIRCGRRTDQLTDVQSPDATQYAPPFPKGGIINYKTCIIHVLCIFQRTLILIENIIQSDLLSTDHIVKICQASLVTMATSGKGPPAIKAKKVWSKSFFLTHWNNVWRAIIVLLKVSGCVCIYVHKSFYLDHNFWTSKDGFHISHMHSLWQDLSHGTIFFLPCALVFEAWPTLKKN